MRIAFVSEHASPLATLGGVDAGGQNVHVAELASGLVRLGHDVTVYTRRDRADLPRRVECPAGYRVVHLDAGPAEFVPKDDLWPLMPEFATDLATELDADRPDLVHAHFWMSGWAAREVTCPRGIPTVMTFHALGAVKRRHLAGDDPSPVERLAIEDDLIEGADRVIATCSDEVAELRATGAQPRRVSVVPCGVDLEVFRSATPAAPSRTATPAGPSRTAGPAGLPRTSGRLRIVSLGRMVPRKGFATVIEALALLPDVELVLAGGGPGPDAERARLRALAEELGVADRVTAVEQLPRADVPALLRSADVVVTVPWYEPFGIVPLEAMACGVPVVASAVGGLLDSVAPGVTGLLVPPRDPAALAAAVASLLDDPELRHRFGRAAEDRARRCFSWDSVAARTAAAYTETLALASAPASASVTFAPVTLATVTR